MLASHISRDVESSLYIAVKTMSLFGGINGESEDEIREISLPGEDWDNFRLGLLIQQWVQEGQSLQKRKQHHTFRHKETMGERPLH